MFEKQIGGVKGAFNQIRGIKFSEIVEGFTTGLGVDFAKTVIGLTKEPSGKIIEPGLATQQLSSQFAAMTGSVEKGTVAYEVFNDVSRNTNYDQAAVMNMGKELMNMGYSAQNEAELISLCANTAAGLGQDVG